MTGLVLTEDFDFRHHLHDTLILLGCKKEIADLLVASQDLMVTEGDIVRLRKYNAALAEQTRDRLANLNRAKIKGQRKR
jgi:hypothetical protein